MCHRPGLQRCSKYPGRRKTNFPDIFEGNYGKSGRSKDPAGSCEREKTKEKEGAEWVSITAFGKLSEICAQYLTKGSQVFVSGRMKTDYYEKDGIKRYSTKIVADRMQMLGGKSDRSESAPSQPKQEPRNAQGAQGGAFDDMESDIPFTKHGAGKAWRVI